MAYNVRIPLVIGIEAGNEELAQKRAEQVEDWIIKGAQAELARHRAAWLGDLASEGMEVEG